jgi:hypothetical protein
MQLGSTWEDVGKKPHWREKMLNTRDLLDALHEVLAQHLPNWSGADPEPEVMMNGEVHSISRICGMLTLDHRRIDTLLAGLRQR